MKTRRVARPRCIHRVQWLTCLPGEQVLRLECGDVRHGCEDVCTVDYCTLDAVPLIDAPVAGFFVQYELHQQQQTAWHRGN